MLGKLALLGAEARPVGGEQHRPSAGRPFVDDEEPVAHIRPVTPAKAGVHAALVTRRPHGFQPSLE
jgi:hypothetical protein